MKVAPVLLSPLLIICLCCCDSAPVKQVANEQLIKSEIDEILKIQEDAYDENSQEGRIKIATTCDDSLLFIGGDDGGLATSANFYVHDLADGYTKRPTDKVYRIHGNTVIVSSIHQSFKIFNHDTIYFNARSTKVFVKDQDEWKMVFTTYAPLPVIYTKTQVVDPEILNDYAGLYRVDPSTTDTVSTEDGKLFLSGAGAEKSELIPVNDSTFISRGHFGKTVFSRNKRGAVVCNYYEFPDGQRLTFPKIK